MKNAWLGSLVILVSMLALHCASGSLKGTQPGVARQQAIERSINVISVPLDNIGIADFRFLNPRNPPSVPPDVPVEFSNRTIDRGFVIEFPTQLTELDEAQREQVRKLRDGSTDDSSLSLRNCERKNDIEHCTVTVILQQGFLGVVVPSLLVKTGLTKFQVRFFQETDVPSYAEGYLYRESVKPIAIDAKMLEEMRKTDAFPHRLGKMHFKESKVLTLRNETDTRVNIKFAFHLTAEGARRAISTVKAPAPHCPSEKKESLKEASTIHCQSESEVTLNDDTNANERLRCIMELSLCPVQTTEPAGMTSVDVPIALLEHGDEATLKLSAVEQNPTPRTAELVIIRAVPEPDDKMVWRPVFSIGGAVDPVLPLSVPDDPSKPPILNVENPYEGDTRDHFFGSALLHLQHTLGNRATSNATFGFKSGDFGGRDTSLSLAATSYRVSVFSVNGLALHFGKFDFAAPSQRIALAEKGDGFRLTLGSVPIGGGRSLGSLSAGLIAKRTSLTPDREADDGDHRSIVVQLENINLPRVFRSANLYLVRGEDQTDKDPHRYETWGGELFYAMPNVGPISGSIALYSSNRSASEGSPSAKGSVWLSRLSWSRIETGADLSASVPFTITATVGAGSADDPATERNEGYVGETQAFAPDKIFFSSLEKPLRLGGVNVGGGLGSKQYLGLQIATTRFSLVRELAEKFLKIPESDIFGDSSVLAVHQYRFRRDVFGERDPGTELSLEFRAESPKGVKVSLGGAYLFAGRAISGIVDRDPWTIFATVSVEP